MTLSTQLQREVQAVDCQHVGWARQSPQNMHARGRPELAPKSGARQPNSRFCCTRFVGTQTDLATSHAKVCA